MNKGKNLIKNTLVLLIGKISVQFISFLMLPLYTGVLSTNDYGIIDIVLTYVALFSPVVTLQLEMAVFRFLVDKRSNEKEKSRIITNVLITSFFCLFVSLSIFYFIANLLNYKYTLYTIFLILTTAIYGIILQISRGEGKNIDYSIACIIAGILNVTLNIYFLVNLKIGLVGMFLAQIISTSISILYLYIKLKIYRNLNIKYYEKSCVKELLDYSFPLVPNGIIWWIINVSDRTIIKLLISNSANGIYAISNKFSGLFINAYNIYNMSWTESVSLNIKNNSDDFINSAFNKSIKFFSLVCLMIISAIPFVFKILINDKYIEAYNYIPILMLGTLANIIASLLGGIYIALKETKKTMYTSLLAGIINILVNMLFIRIIDIYAAALSTLVSFIIIVIYRYVDINKKIKIKIDTKFLTLFIFLYFIVTFTYYSKILILYIVVFASMCLIFIIYNRRSLFNIKRSILKK